jgi:hypothetical protein
MRSGLCVAAVDGPWTLLVQARWSKEKERRKIRNLLEILDSLMGCDLGNITARDERETTLT